MGISLRSMRMVIMKSAPRQPYTVTAHKEAELVRRNAGKTEQMWEAVAQELAAGGDPVIMATERPPLRNPYLEAFNLYMHRTDDRWVRWEPRELNPRDNGFGLVYDGTAIGNAITARDALTHYCAWAVPNDQALQAIADLHMPIIEVGAGTGYWAWLLDQLDVEVVAYDASPNSSNDWCSDDHWVEVMAGSHKTIEWEQFQDYALMLCWPPYDTAMAYNTLKAYQGNTLVYVGEWEGGCNASLNFWREVYKCWEGVQCVPIPQWVGVRDALWILHRK